MSGFDYETLALTIAQTIVLLVIYLIRKELRAGDSFANAKIDREDVLEVDSERANSG